MPKRLGTKLRRVLELLDGDVERGYAEAGLNYRPRFTPVMKALADGSSKSVQEIARISLVSQPAASQTIAMMDDLGLVTLRAGQDGRERLVRLTPKGATVLKKVKSHWLATDRAAKQLQDEAGVDLDATLDSILAALERRSFADRIRKSRAALS